MAETKTHISDQVNHLFRHEYGKLVSVLTKTFGASNMELAEDVVQDAMLEAIRQWEHTGVPENPMGWIYKVAKNKAVNIVNRDQYKREYMSEVAHHLQSEWTIEPALDRMFTDKEIADDQLRMMFTCCNPAVSKDSQVALTLKTLCGFGIPEIANAFLTTEENINKRLVRARKNLREERARFEVPVGSELEPRLNSVLETLYLLFNEGYNATSGKDLIQYELCEEAIRLAEIITDNPSFPFASNAYALLALMCFNASRFKSRTDEFDNIIDLENQDRSLWNQELIQNGLHYLELTTQERTLSIYHILATISAHHCTAKDFASTDWESILQLYDHLMQFDSSPLVVLNRAIVLSKTEGVAPALTVLKSIENEPTIKTYLPFYTAMAALHFLNNNAKEACKLLERALEFTNQEQSKSMIISRLETYSKKD